MDKHLKSCLSRINMEMQNAVGTGRLNGQPFAAFTSEAADVFTGIEVLIEHIQVSRLMTTGGDPEEAARAMNDYEEGALLTLVRTVSSVMASRAEGIADRAEKRLKEGAK